MMIRKQKASHLGGVAGSIKQLQKNFTKNKRYTQQQIMQIMPTQQIMPSTALCAFLKRYKADLLRLEYSNEVSRLVDCCDCILDEATP